MKLKSVAIGLVAGVFLASSLYAGQAGPKKIAGQSQSSGQQSSGAQSDQQSSGKGSGTHSSAMGASEVKQIQQKLKQQGFDPGPADGKFGPKTQEALKQFQQKQGIQPTGQADTQTLAALGVQGQSSGQGGGAESGSSQQGGAMQGGGQSGGTQGGTSPQSPDMGGGQSNGGSSGGSQGSAKQNGGSGQSSGGQ
ncbi:MAG: peptidoglycan-binding protein [Candidatus Manganitrophaceae bacterium]|nr:MAG: peptidoglycan-binding protein [Candidatus Manganitrophaceae bacterium]